MTGPHDFGELRSLLATTPSARAFDATLDLVEAALPQLGEAAYLDQWAPYLEAQLQRWPDSTRRVRDARLRAIEEGPTPWAPLVRTLEYAWSTISEGRCAAICAAEHLAGITHLDLRDAPTSYGVLHRLAAGAPFVLESFALRKSTSSGAKPADLLPLFTSPMLSNLSSLELTGWSRFGASSVKAMIEHLPLTNLKKLDLNDTGVGKSGLKAVLTCEALSGLEWLDLSNLEFGTEQAEALAAATHLTRLKRLALYNSRCNLAELGDLRDAPHVLGLESLDLGMNVLTADEALALCEPELYPNLRELTLRDAQISADALRVLLAAECFSQVTSLDMSGVLLRADALEGAAPWPSLQSLTLHGAAFSAEGWSALAQSAMLDGVTTLVASAIDDERNHGLNYWTRVGREDLLALNLALVSHLLVTPLPGSIEHLDLSSNRLTHEHVEPLLTQPHLSNLRSLYLHSHSPRFEDSLGDGILELARDPALAGLRALSLHASYQDADALEGLLRSGDLPELRALSLTPTPDRALRERLRAAAPSRLRIVGVDDSDVR